MPTPTDLARASVAVSGPRVPKHHVATAVAVLLGLAAVGCWGDDGLGRRYPVAGTVTYNGQPVERATISFMPQDLETGRPATGQVVNGSYTLTTFAANDGALPGTYNVTLLSEEVDLSEVMEEARGGYLREDRVAKAPRTHHIPPKYNLPETSGLTAQVETKVNRIDFELVD